MIDGSKQLVTWQDAYRHIENGVDAETLVSEGSGKEYTVEQLTERIDAELRIMDGGVYPAGPELEGRYVPRVEDGQGDQILRDVIDQEWYDLIAEENGYHSAERFHPFKSASGDTFVSYSTNDRGPLPHQGWKLRVAAYPDEAREVASIVLPYLQEEDISHKVVQDVNGLNNQRNGQEGKFITIYPRIDEDRQDVIMNGGIQQFKREDPSWNAMSINSNTKNARRILEDLEEELRFSPAGLRGCSIDGKNGEEKQYEDTRLHFRYAHHFNTPAEILEGEERAEWVDDHEGLVNEDGEFEDGSYIGDRIDAATRPDEFL